MEKDRVLEILFHYGYIATGDVDNNYIKYTNGINYLWVGNYFIENENLIHAFPFKDDYYNETDFINFILE